MGLGVRIDFRGVYELESVSDDLRVTKFKSRLRDGRLVLLTVKISEEEHELFPGVYNISFGIMDKRGRIDDKARLLHVDYSRVFSTVLLSAVKYRQSLSRFLK